MAARSGKEAEVVEKFSRSRSARDLLRNPEDNGLAWIPEEVREESQLVDTAPAYRYCRRYRCLTIRPRKCYDCHELSSTPFLRALIPVAVSVRKAGSSSSKSSLACTAITARGYSRPQSHILFTFYANHFPSDQANAAAGREDEHQEEEVTRPRSRLTRRSEHRLLLEGKRRTLYNKRYASRANYFVS